MVLQYTLDFPTYLITFLTTLTHTQHQHLDMHNFNPFPQQVLNLFLQLYLHPTATSHLLSLQANHWNIFQGIFHFGTYTCYQVEIVHRLISFTPKAWGFQLNSWGRPVEASVKFEDSFALCIDPPGGQCHHVWNGEVSAQKYSSPQLLARKNYTRFDSVLSSEGFYGF